MDKQDTAHYIMEYDLAIEKKTELIPFLATWMDLEMITLSEVHEREKDKHRMTSLPCGI